VAIGGAKHQAFRSISDQLTASIKEKLRAPLQLGELQAALEAMSTGKSLGPDGIVLEFFKEMWSLIGVEFLGMIQTSLQDGKFPPGMTRGMIALLHKGGLWTALTNSRLITLLNISYKIYAKALQLRLQPILIEVISCEQLTFLPLRFILDNILLTQETMV
jgi:hypothetical protein